MEDERSSLGILLGGIGPIIVASLLVPLRDVINNANIALALVVVVVLAGVFGGRGAGALAAVMSALSFDFFHTRPYLRLTIDAQDDVETTILLLVVGLVVGTMTAQARKARSSAELGRSELRRIHRLAERVAAGDDATDVIMAAQTELTGLLGLKEARFEAPPFAGSYPQLERSGVITGLTERRVARGGFELPAEGVELSVLARGHRVGRFVLVPTPDVGVSLEERVVAVALADQVGAAIGIRRPTSSPPSPEGNSRDA